MIVFLLPVAQYLRGARKLVAWWLTCWLQSAKNDSALHFLRLSAIRLLSISMLSRSLATDALGNGSTNIFWDGHDSLSQ